MNLNIDVYFCLYLEQDSYSKLDLYFDFNLGLVLTLETNLDLYFDLKINLDSYSKLDLYFDLNLGLELTLEPKHRRIFLFVP